MIERELEFINMLKSIMLVYGATIGFTVGESSDTWGLYDERMIIRLGEARILEIDGWSFNAHDIDKAMETN